MKPKKGSPKKHVILVALPPEIHAALVRAAKKASRSTRAHASFIIQQELDRTAQATQG